MMLDIELNKKRGSVQKNPLYNAYMYNSYEKSGPEFKKKYFFCQSD